MSDLLTLLPPNATPIELELEQVVASRHTTPEQISTLWDPMTCPEALLPWLAWALSVDSWDSSWPVATKRAIIAASPAVHRHKGTRAAINQAVTALGGTVTMREWWETVPPGTPFTFTLILSVTGDPGVEASADYVNAVIDAVNQTKNLRSHYTFTSAILGYAPVGVVAGARAVSYRRLDMGEATFVPPTDGADWISEWDWAA